MTKEQSERVFLLESLAKDLLPMQTVVARCEDSSIWKKAFEEYNKENTPVHMRCRVCYPKVYIYLKKKYGREIL